jgi:regulator of RNase E activity RraA
MVDFGLPVKVGGLVIHPGDLLHGDLHGVVVVPRDIAAEIPERAAAIEARERRMIAACQASRVTVEKLKAARKDMQQSY